MEYNQIVHDIKTLLSIILLSTVIVSIAFGIGVLITSVIMWIENLLFI